MRRHAQFNTLLMIHVLALFGNASPLNSLRLYQSPTELDTLTNQMTKSVDPLNQQELVLIEDEPVLVYIPDTDESDLLSSLLMSKLNGIRKANSRLRRAFSGNTNPASSPINYQQVWPVLNAAKDRAVELAEEGHRRKAEQSVTKRQEWELPNPEATERLTRFSRNLPEQDKFQIQNLGDLPMFRFG